MSDSTNNAPTLHWHGLQPFITVIFEPWPWEPTPAIVRANNELLVRAAISNELVRVKK